MVAQEFQPVQWELFVIRLTRESGRPGWRGQVIHLPDRQSHTFSSWDDARRFINQFVPEEPSPPEVPLL